ncbi:MAG: hypothetical protein GF330_06510 [Candidatus Eisenbacteria bacterium]|nr:hypothetical protein [Candidatus Eisenbacteria bacterium]
MRRPVWANLPQEELLELRLCDLGLKIEGTALEQRTSRVQQELERRGLRFRPYFWLSDDWFTPSGMTGCAIPFYLAHPRLIRLERKQIGEAEGARREWCMKLLRHEVGHAIDHAFRLTRRRKRQQLFGRSTIGYPRYYRPNPYSRRHVQHLEYWYAQSHPDEDFAETFAVWLAPRSRWRQRYAEWPRALRKLEYVDALMRELAGERPPVRTRARLESVRTLRKTLREHYHRKRSVYAVKPTDIYDRDLLRLFTRRRPRTGRETAAGFIRRVRPEIVRAVARWTGEHGYVLEHVLKDMLARCRELRLYVQGSERQARRDFTILLVKHTIDALYRNRRWVEM